MMPAVSRFYLSFSLQITPPNRMRRLQSVTAHIAQSMSLDGVQLGRASNTVLEPPFSRQSNGIRPLVLPGCAGVLLESYYIGFT
ncbi:hypothetical protein HBH56_017990 [Parastagonospora nodorum]|uniref:Uncharacterized protein n=1 Tax=Phaeosphaeria nodorum (strain SN15 / ATCC MYA-4574 / FGSC 10173) TaxID=321614 RepID=A0A7U2EY86_PHANO|nr:hypothetical protein HBH56_017990 [Parastagonospora nodorum]QRC95230.1 hypothetical protein JI435_407080 [Parastagonospora nodorum SN15]KAH3937302.1 hypothetical protein HBH54_016510 [Parastagonospora nodorum]KAH3962734.1 hypothetical protein HBH51_173130 [Parastagonospora nodorum]KAH3990713.1 hypothetical protein HBH52_005410 [Parastagonospora nodorum]